MATVLITGGAGFIGSHLVDRLLSIGHSVIAVDDLSSGRRAHLPRESPAFSFVHESVLDVARWATRLRGVDCVFHLAALISGYESLPQPERYLATNVTGLVRLVRALEGKARPRFVFASSSAVYGNCPRAIRRETDPPAPGTVYALTKLTGEHVLDMYRQSVGYDDVSFRLFNVYGPRQNSDHPYANVTCKLAWAAATGAPVSLYGDGTQTRDFVYVEDVINVFVAAMGGRLRRRVYNLGTGRQMSVKSLLELAESISGRRLRVEHRAPWPNDIEAIFADVTRLREDLGFAPETPVEQGLSQTIASFGAAASPR